MLIINQWATDAVGFITDDISQKNQVEDGKPITCLYINGDCYAKSKNYDLMNELQYRLHEFIDKCHRTTDTFDIKAEMVSITENKPQIFITAQNEKQ